MGQGRKAKKLARRTEMIASVEADASVEHLPKWKRMREVAKRLTSNALAKRQRHKDKMKKKKEDKAIAAAAKRTAVEADAVPVVEADAVPVVEADVVPVVHTKPGGHKSHRMRSGSAPYRPAGHHVHTSSSEPREPFTDAGLAMVPSGHIASSALPSTQYDPSLQWKARSVFIGQ